MGEVNSCRFTFSRESRNRICADKDTAMRPIYDRLRVRYPARFRAILMPGMFGREAYFCRERDVPAKNLFAVEDNSIKAGIDIHREIAVCRHPDRRVLRGMKTTPEPMEASEALDFISDRYAGYAWDLVYFDFMGQPRFGKHFTGCLRKLFANRMFKRDASLILTFSHGRTQHVEAELNRSITDVTDAVVPTETYLKYLLFATRYPPPFRLESCCYVSKVTVKRVPLRFVTTVLHLGRGA